MSSDVDDEQVLPDSLQKLEIVPVCSRSNLLHVPKFNELRNRNPFSITSSLNDIDERISKDLFGPTCSSCKNDDGNGRQTAAIAECSKNSISKNWRTRRGNNSNLATNNSGSSDSGLERSVQKQIHFKQREKDKPQILKSETKVRILRDPILKSIGRYIHHNGNQRRLCYNAVGIDGSSSSKISGIRAPFELGSRNCKKNYNPAIDSNFDRPVHSTADTNNVMINGLQKWQLDDEATVDFRSLVNDCSNMSLSATFRSDDCSTNELHKTRNFQVLQTNTDPSALTGDSRDVGHSSEATTANTSTLLNSNGNLSSSNSKTSSCSQQARMNSSNCDVTIDELASYFETFVHIPKKMSSMAEMMYI